MKKKIFLLILLIPILFIVYLIGPSTWLRASAQSISAQDSENNSIYIVSENSFQYSTENDLYYEEHDKRVHQPDANKLLGYVWTKTGDLVNTLKDLCVSGFEETKPLTRAQGPMLLKLLQGPNEISTSVLKTLGPGQEILKAAHHPWIFLMSLSFGTILLSLWFLRLSTGVSPPVTVNKLTN